MDHPAPNRLDNAARCPQVHKADDEFIFEQKNDQGPAKAGTLGGMLN